MHELGQYIIKSEVSGVECPQGTVSNTASLQMRQSTFMKKCNHSIGRLIIALNSQYPTLLLLIQSYVHELFRNLNEKLALFIFSSITNNHLHSCFSRQRPNNLQSLLSLFRFQLKLRNSRVPAVDLFSDSNYIL